MKSFEDLVQGYIDCPIEWCAGYLLDHGGTGEAPDEWYHSSAGITLPHGLMLVRAAHASGPERWIIEGRGYELVQDADLHVIAARLHEVASAIDSRVGEEER